MWDISEDRVELQVCSLGIALTACVHFHWPTALPVTGHRGGCAERAQGSGLTYRVCDPGSEVADEDRGLRRAAAERNAQAGPTGARFAPGSNRRYGIRHSIPGW